MSTTASENDPVVDNHHPSPAGSQLYFEAYFSPFKMSTNKRLVCVNFDFNIAVSHLCEFEETLADHGHIKIAFSLTHIA